MKSYTLLLVILCAALITQAQGTLQFNAAKIVSNSLLTVPSGKVWKITSIYGADYICVASQYPKYVGSSSSYGGPGYYVAYVGSGIQVNGVDIPSARTWSMYSGNLINVFDTPSCTGSGVTGSQNRGWGAFDVAANPNILPQWLPAGTTLKSTSANVFISVLEFNIVP